MPPRLAKYNPDQVSITCGGVLIQGFADGEFITVEQMTPSFDEVVGTDGEVARSRTSDKRLKVVIKLLQTSQSNPILSSLHNDDVNDPAGITFEFQMEDTLGGSIAFGAESWVTEIPSASMDRTAKSREWEIHVANGTREEAGN
jgi:hypothetical protein